MKLAQAWQRLVRRRWTDPARLQARETMNMVGWLRGPMASHDARKAADQMERCARALERLASVLDDVAEPGEDE